jgi:hypothetical protein
MSANDLSPNCLLKNYSLRENGSGLTWPNYGWKSVMKLSGNQEQKMNEYTFISTTFVAIPPPKRGFVSS